MTDRDVWLVVIAMVMLAVALAVLIGVLLSLNRQAQDAAKTHQAVCVYRSDLLRQVRGTANYLIKHPDGVPAIGISRGALEATLERQRSAYDSLTDLNCS